MNKYINVHSFIQICMKRNRKLWIIIRMMMVGTWEEIRPQERKRCPHTKSDGNSSLKIFINGHDCGDF